MLLPLLLDLPLCQVRGGGATSNLACLALEASPFANVALVAGFSVTMVPICLPIRSQERQDVPRRPLESADPSSLQLQHIP